MDRDASHKLPEIRVEASKFFLCNYAKYGIQDCRFNFKAIPNNPRVPEQEFNPGRLEVGNLLYLKFGKGSAIGLPFLQNGNPAQASLCTFKYQELK